MGITARRPEIDFLEAQTRFLHHCHHLHSLVHEEKHCFAPNFAIFLLRMVHEQPSAADFKPWHYYVEIFRFLGAKMLVVDNFLCNQ